MSGQALKETSDKKPFADTPGAGRKKVLVKTIVKKMLADMYTPVGIYLRLRDRFRDTILLESADFHVAENSYSFICINAIAGIQVTNWEHAEFKLPGQAPEKTSLSNERIEDIL